MSHILGEYLALDRAKIFRRLMVRRCGLLALLAVIAGIAAHGLSPVARWLPAGLCLTAPVCAWVVELRRSLRLSRRLAEIHGSVTRAVPETRSSPWHKKVIKSS